MAHFYRFRSTDALLDKRNELEDQEIYFCPPEDLNDPIEGFKDLFWRADEIVWRNFLKHYLLCLMRSYCIAVVGGPESGPVPSKGIILGSRESLPSEQLKTLHEQICERFFATDGAGELPTILGDCPYPLRRNGLAFCLRGIHAIALQCVIEELHRANLLPNEFGSVIPATDTSQLVGAVTTALKRLTVNDEHLDPATFEIAFFVGDLLVQQVELSNYTRAQDDVERAWLSLLQFYPETYIEQLDYLVYSDWYAACFVSDPTHAAMWGHYGDSHKGVCLKFNSFENGDQRPAIQLYGLTGGYGGPQGSGASYGYRELRFTKMRYVPTFVEIDFFRSMGVVPMPILRSEWFTDDNGNVSSCADQIFSVEDEWRRDYWETFNSMTTAKFRDWEYEGEHRLILTSALNLFTEKHDRKLKYRFADLEGVIFGMKTSRLDKLKIINIIEAKCKAEGRKTFEFSQAAYDPATGRFVTHTLDALRFE